MSWFSGVMSFTVASRKTLFYVRITKNYVTWSADFLEVAHRLNQIEFGKGTWHGPTCLESILTTFVSCSLLASQSCVSLTCYLLYIYSLFCTNAAIDMMCTNQKHRKIKYIKINAHKREKKRKKEQTNKRLLYENYVTQTVHRPIFVLLPVLRVNKSMRHFCTHIATFWPLPMFFDPTHLILICISVFHCRTVANLLSIKWQWDDDDEIAYFTVCWKTRASFVYRTKNIR